MVMKVFNTSTWEAAPDGISEFEASLVYRVSSRIARATHPILKEQKARAMVAVRN